MGALALTAGEIRAAVHGSRSRPYDVRVRVKTYTADEWVRVVDSLAGRLGHAAALLDGELPPEVADELRTAGLDPLPGAGEVQPRCTCPDWADPCKHAAAVCYLVADALDGDPFQLFALRGRSRDELLAALRGRRGSPAPEPGQGEELLGWVRDAGMPARDAWTARPGPLPSIPLPPRAPGRPTVLGADPPAETGLSAESLRLIASDVAGRAWALSQGADSSGLDLTLDEDLARLAAARLGGPGDAPPGDRDSGIADLASRAGVPARVLLRWALAWRDGGRPMLAALRDSNPADPAALEAARAAVGPGVTLWRNRLTAGDRQLRVGADGRWYPFRRGRDGSWDPDGPPSEPPGPPSPGDH